MEKNPEHFGFAITEKYIQKRQNKKEGQPTGCPFLFESPEKFFKRFEHGCFCFVLNLGFSFMLTIVFEHLFSFCVKDLLRGISIKIHPVVILRHVFKNSVL